MSGKNRENFSDLHSVSSAEAAQIIEGIPDQDYVDSLAEIFRALGDQTRVKILYLLGEEEMCVHDLATLLGSSQSSVSHHLKTLRLNNLVKTRREGKAVYYSLADQHVQRLFSQCMDHVEHE